MSALVSPSVHDVELLAYQPSVAVRLAGSNDFRSPDVETRAVSLPLLRQVKGAGCDCVVLCVFDYQAVGR